MKSVGNSRVALSPKSVTTDPSFHLSTHIADKTDRELTLINAQEYCIMKKVQDWFQGKALFLSGYVKN